ncbi:hypothetical protein BDR04DRAFT_1235610 [Suillus decipiens]|nr:hypothetical protein BDR04DRAFT_1235617 [Suillus decipiens]KAG2062984.1 hypothetical protein BDR04DRAFT_1235610 [Suillus decipiens]
MYNTPLMTHQFVATHAGPHGQAPTRGINFAGSYQKDSESDFESSLKHEKIVPSPLPTPDGVVPRLSRGDSTIVDGGTTRLEHHDDLPSWTPLVVSDGEASMDELPLGTEDPKAPPPTDAIKTQKYRKGLVHSPPIVMPRREVQQTSSRISGVHSESRDFHSSQSLQDILQVTFNANGSPNIPPTVTPIDSEESSTDVQAVSYSKRLRRIQNTRRSASQEGSQAEAIAVVHAPIPNTATAVPTIAPRKSAHAIPYESMQKAIDAALDTRVARITWHRRRHAAGCDTDKKSQDDTSRTRSFPFEDAIFDDVPTSTHQEDHHSEIKSGLASVEDEHRTLPPKFTQLDGVQTAALPQQSRGEKFNKRLDAMFGGADTPHLRDGLITPVTADSTYALVPVRDVAASKERSPISSSNSAASVDTSISQSTEATSIAGHNDVQVSPKRTYAESRLEYEPVQKKYKIEITEDQVSEWIAALQRLVKGKTKFGHKGMEDLSIVLAEIESVYPHLDSELTSVTCLQDILQQLTQLEDIPFRDEHNLRRRTDDIIAEWPRVKA